MATTPTKDQIQQWVTDKKWNATMVRAAVVSGQLTKEEADAIIESANKPATKKRATRKKTTTE